MLDKKTRQIFQIIMIIVAALALTMGAITLYYVFGFGGDKMPYFVNYYGMGVTLMLTGVLAFLLTYTSQTKYQGNGKDSMMIVVAGLLMLCGILAIVFKYMGVM